MKANQTGAVVPGPCAARSSPLFERNPRTPRCDRSAPKLFASAHSGAATEAAPPALHFASYFRQNMPVLPTFLPAVQAESASFANFLASYFRQNVPDLPSFFPAS